MKPFLVLLIAAFAVLFGQEKQAAKQGQSSGHAPDPALDRMVAAGKSPQELARYVFQTHGCKSCHTMGEQGKLGFTERGKERAKNFEGCIKMLTAMTVIVQVSEDRRTPQQRDKAARFQEFGCTSCHQVSPGKLSLTEAGAKLKHLHLGCVDVEKLVTSENSHQN